MSVFRTSEIEYLAGGRQLGRIATVGADGTPHVVPVAFIYNAVRDTIDIGGYELEATKKFRDVARTGRAAIVIDDLASTDPWHPRGIEVRGRGEAIALPTPLLRIHPERIVSWGLEQARSARTVPLLAAVCAALAVAFAAPPQAGAAAVPRKARAVNTSHPDRWVGTGTPRSCTSRAVVRAVAKGGVIRFRCGPKPVRIEMRQTAKVVNTSRRVVLDGRGLVTLSGGRKRRILYQNTCDQRQTWTTSHCDDQATPRLVVQNLAFADGNSTGETYEGGGGGAIFVRGGRLKIVGSTFTRNRCDPTRPGPRRRRRAGAVAVPRPTGVRRRQQVHPRGLQQRGRAEQHRRLVVDLQQRLHRQPRRSAAAPTPRARARPAADRAARSTRTATASASCSPARR